MDLITLNHVSLKKRTKKKIGLKFNLNKRLVEIRKWLYSVLRKVLERR